MRAFDSSSDNRRKSGCFRFCPTNMTFLGTYFTIILSLLVFVMSAIMIGLGYYNSQDCVCNTNVNLQTMGSLLLGGVLSRWGLKK